MTSGARSNTPAGIQVQLPDLVTTSFSAKRAFISGASRLQLKLRWINRGMVKAGGHTSELYLSTDSQLSEDDLTLASFPLKNGIWPYGGYYYDTNEFVREMDDLLKVREPGFYYVISKLDVNGEVEESEEQNNVRVSELVYIGLDRYDVVLSSFNLGTSSSTVGNPLKFDVSVTNRGTLSLPDVPLSVYLSSDTSWDEDDVLVCSKSPALNLAVDGTRKVEESCTIPRVRGDFFVIVVADPNDTNEDEDRSNNVVASSSKISISAPFVDLSLSNVKGTFTAPAWPQGVSLSAVVQNSGVDVVSNVQVSFFLSRDAVHSSEDLLICRTSFGSSLAPQTSGNLTETCDVPSRATGTYTLIAVVDPQDVIFETNETNNTANAPSSLVIPKLDLNWAVRSLSFSHFSRKIGEDLSVEVNIENTGTLATPSSRVNIHVAQQKAMTAFDPLLCYASIPSLAPKSGQSFTLTCKVPTLDTGKYYVGAIVDPSESVPETNEGDNKVIYDQDQLMITN